MRRVLVFTVIFALLQPAAAAPVTPPSSGAPDAVLKWIKNYRAKPKPMAVPAVMRALSAHGTIKDPESSGVYAASMPVF